MVFVPPVATIVPVVSKAGLQALQGIGIRNATLAGPMCNMDAFGPSDERDAKAAELRKTYGLESRFVVLAPSRIARDKGTMELIRAIAILKQHGYKNIVAVIIGAVYSKTFMKEIDDAILSNNLQDNVLIFEQMSQDDLSIWHSFN